MAERSTNSDNVLTQVNRVARLTTPLGPNVLNIHEFHASEGLSELFEFRMTALAEKVYLSFDSAIGAGCHVAIRTKTSAGGASSSRQPANDRVSDGPGGGVDRDFHGILTEARWLGQRGDHYAYELVMRPWFWLLSRATDCRIFHEKTVQEIVEQVFQDRGFNDFKFRLTENYPKRHYCVQYRETDLEFVCRLLEEEGIYYYFEHSAGKHEMQLVDSESGHDPNKVVPKLPFPRTGRARTDMETITDLVAGRLFQTGKVTFNDYDYLKPNAALKGQSSNSPNHTLGTLESYDYPGRYSSYEPAKRTSDQGERLSKVRLQSLQTEDDRRIAMGDALSLFPGTLFTLTEHPEATLNIKYLVVRTSHSFRAQEYRSGGADAEEAYEGTYELQPADKPYRAPQITPWPTINGPQTAKVVGKKGEEIDVDDHGRILVRFHWDHREDLSCRVRVAQTLSGKKWGAIFIPRIGQEVVIEHLEGNPDQPLCVGTVYNGENTVPYELPANKTINGWKTETSKGGNGYNEFYFDDKKDSEKINLHAQKDYELVVLNTEHRTVAEEFKGSGESRTALIKKGDDLLKVESGNRTVEVQKDLTTKVTGNEDRKVTGNRDTKVTGNHKENVTGKQDVSVTGKITIESTTGIDLKVGANKISITQSGITISAMQVAVKATTTMELKALSTTMKADTQLELKGLMTAIKGDVMTDVKGLMTNVKGDAMTTVKGAIVMIN